MVTVPLLLPFVLLLNSVVAVVAVGSPSGVVASDVAAVSEM